MRIYKIISLSICLILFVCAKAQRNQYHFSRIDISAGLSNNEVNCIIKDEKGFLWFGTRSGLNRFDGYKFKVYKHDLRDTTSISDDDVTQLFEGPEHTLWINTKTSLVVYNLLTEKFSRQAQKKLTAYGIGDTLITAIRKDNNGNYWFLSSASGLYKYNPSTQTSTRLFYEAKSADDYQAKRITDFSLAEPGFLWVVDFTGTVSKMDLSTGKTVFSAPLLKGINPNVTDGFLMYVDAQKHLWFYSPGVALGVFYYNISTQSMVHITKGTSGKALNNDVVRSIAQDDNGLIWVATDHGGVNLIDKASLEVQYLLNNDDDAHSIVQNSIDAMYTDNNGIIWIGTFKKGLCYYHKDIIKFPLYRHKPSLPDGLPFNDVNRFLEDAKGNIWVGTNGGGLIYYNRQTAKFTTYKHNAADAGSICSDVIVSMCLDHNQTLWIGTYFGGLDSFDGTNFTHYKHNAADANSISDNSIWSLLEDSQQRLWIGTFSAGLDRFDRATKQFVHYKPTGWHSVHCAYICDLLETRNGDIWIGSASGIDVLEKSTNDFKHFYNQDKARPQTSLSNNNTIAMLQDSRGLIWVTTREGLDYYDPSKDVFTTLRMEDGLPDNIIMSIVEDQQHNLWVGTPNGLCNIIVEKNAESGHLFFQFRNYNEADGLQGREFNEYSAYATRDGYLLFGGSNGFNMFKPQQINSTAHNPLLAITDIQMFNRSVAVGENLNGHVILPQAISDTKEIALKYNENVFSIEFAALNFFYTAKLRYAYTLEGFSNEWLIADDKTHKATYTNLDPGNYVFKVRAINENGVFGKEEATLRIRILPPFWRTPVAYTLYALLLVASLYIARRLVLKRASTRFALEQERMEAQRLHELDMMKIRFFTNISHDFRTPLSLILTPLDKIIKHTAEASQKNQFQMIHRNARRLLNMVNQLLDFRKMEMQELKLNPSSGDIIRFIKEISYSFTDLAEKKNIKFCYASSVNRLVAAFDHDKIERMLFNLLSNAFKFTPEGGTVTVQLAAAEATGKDKTLLEIRVSDTGIGIPAEKHEKIFERFFQNDANGKMVSQGSGLGLAITREFVKLMDGTVAVQSEVNKGTCFIVQLPLEEVDAVLPGAATVTGQDGLEVLAETVDAQLPPEEAVAIDVIEPVQEAAPEKTDATGTKKPVVLIVEDNEDLRFYLKDNLKQYFTIVEAVNGKAGWQKALAAHPDVIVSDISMPEMNGIDLCRKIKSDKRTMFVPVILLTALMGEEQQLAGLETGASDYMTKPFNFEILLSKIRNLLTQQAVAKRTYQKQVSAAPTEITVESPDEKFMQSALKMVETNISNPDLSVEELSRGLLMSRVALYKKLLALTGKTPLEFIRSIRLKRALQLLEKSNLTVAEIAYEVGFNDPKYFSKFFKAEFNMLPSAYIALKRKGQGTADAAVKEESVDNIV